jgi:Mn-dependent DtxR family transcriptional regulator
LGERQAEIDACKVEHLLSAKTGQQLLHFVQFLLSDDAIAKQFLTEFWARLEVTDTNRWPILNVEQLLKTETQKI